MQSLNEFEKRHLQGFAGKQVRELHTRHIQTAHVCRAKTHPNRSSPNSHVDVAWADVCGLLAVVCVQGLGVIYS